MTAQATTMEKRPDHSDRNTSSRSAPVDLSMGRVALTVSDLDRVSAFYEQAVGLHLLRRDGETATLGTGHNTLLHLRREASARRRAPREAGLFHIAFLLPTRADLARWTKHAIATRVPMVGASDHDVSEALYLSDPEGNGVEIYADRDRSSWIWENEQVHMSTNPLDVADLLASAGDTTWRGFPDGSIVGHVHLQVGALAQAEAFYGDALGLDVTCRYPGAAFYAANGYHHHIATNIWNSRGAGPRSYPSTGLAEVDIHVSSERADAIGQRLRLVKEPAPFFSLQDPWGTAIAIAPIVSPSTREA